MAETNHGEETEPVWEATPTLSAAILMLLRLQDGQTQSGAGQD